MNVLNNEIKHQYYFEEISKIPRGSSNEQAISNYLVLFAKEHQLKYYQDKIGNVVIYKDASKDYEKHEVIMLQAHIDMVCESCGSGSFDFENDPLKLVLEDGFVKASGTTLGADDGVGVAYMLSVLEDNTLLHPALECVFTVQEETTMEGAIKLDKEVLKSRSLINIDGEVEGVTITASAGGIDIIMDKAFMKVSPKYNMFEILVTGLSGGHSGAEIHKEKGNAIKIMGRLLNVLRKQKSVHIANIEGGQKINAIPRETSAIIAIDMDIDTIKKEIEKFARAINVEYQYSDSGIMFDVCTLKSLHGALSSKDSNIVIDTLMLLPTGLRSRCEALNGLTMSSSNIGICAFHDNIFHVEASVRGANDTYVRDLEDEYLIIGNMLDYEIYSDNWYPGFDYLKNSRLRNVMSEVYAQMYHDELKMEAIHGGLECGLFKDKLGEIDIVTIGCNIYDAHAPSESLDIASFDRTYKFLCSFLKAL